MMREAVLHVPRGSYAYAVSEEEARIRLRARKGDLKRVFVKHEDRFEAPGSLGVVEMEFVGADEMFDTFEALVWSKSKRIRYRFWLDDGSSRVWYAEGGFADVEEKAGWFHLPYLNRSDLFTVPEWVGDAVVYQVFPDRFWNGDPSNDPEGVLPWGDAPTSSTFFGGDLEGILQKLPYLEELGVNLLYLTPIFRSPSTHKYDTVDYFSVDPMFGDVEVCKRLVEQAHQRGIRVMLDAVFNHCGWLFPPFQDVVENGEASEFAGWFHVKEFPVDTVKVNYETFAEKVAQMPKFRTEHPEVRRYLLSVAGFWVKEVGIDGWRLDVADEVDHAFWREFRTVVKAANPEALIVGEAWHESAEWLNGDQWDSVMNYLFRDACLAFFAKREIDAEAFDARLTKTRMLYKEQANRAMFNLLGSHDTARFLTVCGERKDWMKLAVMFQMTYVGIPEVYYGDEVGMVGETDPDCRRTMVWEEERQDAEMLELHRRLIALRKKFKALQVGCFRAVAAEAGKHLYAYVREAAGERICVVLNHSKDAVDFALPDGCRGVDLLDGRLFVAEVPVDGFGGRVLLLESS